LLESETNGSLAIGVSGRDGDPLVVTALGISVLVAVGPTSRVLACVSSLGDACRRGPEVLAAGCDRALRSVHHLPPGFTPTLSFSNPVNAQRFLARIG
jgi:hypothetical protein